jgi:YegS/Rv2252/BmrU family lipid kinase
MEKQRILFIVNPFAGTSSKHNISDQIPKFLDQSKYDYHIKFTGYPQHGHELALQAVEDGIDIIIANGGDGTVNEVASAIVGSNSTFGIIPGGSGNGFSMHLGLGRSFQKAMKAINDGKIITIDTCKLNDSFYVNVAGFGFDARIAFLTKANKERGFTHYFTTTIKESRKFKAEHLKLDIDGKVIEGKFAAAVVANASRYGYSFTVAPMAQLTDGVLDIILIKEASVPRYFLSAYRFFNKTLHLSRLTEAHQGKKIKITSPNPVFYHLDGEGYEAINEFTVEVVPQSLKLIIPSDKAVK